MNPVAEFFCWYFGLAIVALFIAGVQGRTSIDTPLGRIPFAGVLALITFAWPVFVPYVIWSFGDWFTNLRP